MNKVNLFSISYISIWVLVLFQGSLALALLRRLEELRNLIRQASCNNADVSCKFSKSLEYVGDLSAEDWTMLVQSRRSNARCGTGHHSND